MKEIPRSPDGERVRKVDVHDLIASADCQKQEMRVGPHVGGGGRADCWMWMVSIMHISV